MADIGDRYEMIRELGRGGMGVVYQARDKSLGRIVALKRVLASGNRAIIERFLAEAKSIAALNHPNIIQIFDIGKDANGLFITTEFVDGGDLHHLIKTKGPIAPVAAAKLLLPVCQAMHYAHQKGVIHRDLKPGNILLTKDNVPKIADFGLARTESMKEQEMTGMVMGTQNYASPEQFTDSKHVDHRTDIYSLGAVFFEILTAVSPRYFRESQIPEIFKTVIMKAMEADRARRYQSLDKMMADIVAAARGNAAAPVNQAPAAPRAAPPPASIALDKDSILIPAGPFIFGPTGRRADLPAFAIDAFPVTNERFAKVFPSHFFKPEEKNHPAGGITWVQASEYAKKIGKRLPTEAEWEKAARGTDGRRFPWGNEFSPERCNSFESGNGTTTPVDAYPSGRSPYGVWDMAGNIWEWTATRHEQIPSFRILKGGAYDGKAEFTQCFERFAHHASGLFHASGFRCVRSAG